MDTSGIVKVEFHSVVVTKLYLAFQGQWFCFLHIFLLRNYFLLCIEGKNY